MSKKLLNYRRIITVFILSIFIFMPSGGGLLALSPEDVNSIYDQTEWYRTDNFVTGGGTPGCTSDSLGGVTAGSGAPNGAEFPNLDPIAMANAINTWIPTKNPNSKLSGLGATIVADGKNSNVSPFLIVAIAAQESSLSDPSDYNVSHGNNSFGRSAAPGQPSFQGARAWYYWTSVKASVDYTAPENQNAQGGGDMGTFIRNVYSAELASGDIFAFFMKYAPPSDGNNTQAYAEKVRGWIDELVKLAGGQPVPVSGGTTGGCNAGGVFSGDIVKTALGLAWPSGDHGKEMADATPAYQTAMPKYNGASTDDEWSDCGVFVATVMIASGADSSYPKRGTSVQGPYVRDSGKYTVMIAQDTSQLVPGDILIYNGSDGGHTFVYVGNQAGFQGDGASASWHDHVPQAVSASASFAYNGRGASGNYIAARLK